MLDFLGSIDAKPNTLQIMLHTLSLFARNNNRIYTLSCGVHACIPEIVQTLQERFPDTTIVFDPMNTCISIGPEIGHFKWKKGVHGQFCIRPTGISWLGCWLQSILSHRVTSGFFLVAHQFGKIH